MNKEPLSSDSVGTGKSIAIFLRSIKFEHTIFALPFAYLTLFLVESGIPSPGNVLWITLAMVGARTFAMGINRIIDAEIDARNPRTKERPIASGALSQVKALLFSLIALVIFMGATFQLNEICRYLMPAVVIPMVAYPYTKRFTWACHLVLGLVYLMVPPAVWLAVTGEMPFGVVILGIGAGLWVVGFDILYACQDVESDREQGLHSIVADFGIERGMLIARLFHVGTIVTITIAGVLLGVGVFYYLGVIAFLALLAHEHHIISPHDLSRLSEAFFTMNGIISIAFFGFVVADVLLE